MHKLTRWNDPLGSSVGHWLVSGLPGLVLVSLRSSGRWTFLFFPPDSTIWQLRVCAHQPGPNARAEQLLADCPFLREEYPTRGAALLALERALAEPQPGALAEALGTRTA